MARTAEGSTRELLSRLRDGLQQTYMVHEPVGAGGMAVVFRATRRSDERSVAIKVVHPAIGRVLGHDRFRHEVETLRALDHPGIAPLLDFGEREDLLYLVMPFFAGPTLRDRLTAEGQLGVDDAVRITRALLEALDYAHRHNTLHRDVKPENILFDGDRPVLADFGIARAIIRSGGEGLSSTGIVLGTPAYMSPEQADGARQLDGRADLYSVGCVLFEMLAGVPPFVGPSQQVIQSRHLHEPPPDLGNIRPGLPAGLITAVTRALAKVPADRFHAADEFGRALESARLGRPRSRRRRRWPVVAALVLAALGGVWAYRGRGPALVEDRYLLLPFRGAATGPAVVPSADQVGRLLWRELSRWTGLDLVDEAAVQDQLSRDPRWGLSPEAARAMATALRAGRVIWGDLVTVGDSVEVRAGLYRADAPSQPIRRVQVTVPVGATGSAKALTEPMVTLARGLIAAEATLSDDIGRMATSSYPALLATLAGDSALLQWDLGSARAFYRRAIEADPNFGAPKLRYATASLWAAVPEAEWTSAAAAALAAADQLSPIERLEARALDALARADFPQACRAFDQVIAADSVRFNGWYGRGECLTRDDVVVPDRASPSGWRFRGSFAAGVAAHRMALRLVPYAHRALGGAAVDRLAARLMAGTNWLRVGRAAGASDPKYAAFLGYEGDSLGFTPYPIDQVLAGRRMPVSMARAVREARRSLLAITSGWIAEYPGSVAAVKAHAYALEVNGMVTGAPSQSALALIRTLGAGLPSDSVDFELGAWEVRLLLKARRYSAASQLAGRLLAMASPAAASMAEPAASLRPGLAALIGRADLAAGWSEHLGQGPFVSLDGQVIDSPEGLLQTARRLLAYAAVGGPRDSLRAIEARLRREVTAQVEPSRQALVYETLRLQAAHLAYPDLDPPADTVLPMSRIEHALARGDRKAGLAEFERLAVSRAGQGAGGVAPEYLVLEARLLAMLGDSAAARSKLDGLLADLRVLNQDLLGWVPSAAAIGRGLGLRAALGGDMSLSGADTASQALWRRRGRE